MKFLIIICLTLIGLVFAAEDFDKKACFLPPETGSCRAMFHKFFYNSTSKSCEEFVYGGCGGNANSFDNIIDCESNCKVVQIDLRMNTNGTTDGKGRASRLPTFELLIFLPVTIIGLLAL